MSVGGLSQLREVSYVAWHLDRSHRPSHRTFGGRNGNAAQERCCHVTAVVDERSRSELRLPHLAASFFNQARLGRRFVAMADASETLHLF